MSVPPAHSGEVAANPPRAGRLARLSLAHRLPLVMVVLLLAAAVLSMAVSWRVLSRSAESDTSGRLGSAAQQIASSAAAVADAHRIRLEQAAADPELRRALRGGPPSPAAALLLESLVQGPPEGTVELRRSDGSLVLRLGPEPSTALWPEDGVEAVVPVHRMQAEGGAAYSWTVVPVTDAGARVGWVSRRMKIGSSTSADQTLAELTGERVTIYLRNDDRSLWARSSGAVEEGPRAAIPHGGAVSYAWPGQGRMLAGERPVPGTPLVAVVHTPLALVHARAREIVGSLAIASLLIALLGTMVASMLARQLTRPLAQVTRAAEAIAAGDYDRRLRVVGGDEYTRLATTFNQMAAEIKGARRELMARIDQAQHARRDSDALRAAAEQARRLAEEANRAKSDFLAVMSHELRTPLNAIAGYTQLLDMGIHGPLNDAQHEALQRIARNQAHLLTLIDDVLRYAQLEAGKVEFALRVVPLDDALSELETFFEPQIQAAGLMLDLETENARLSVVADPDKLHQILLNLLSNAAKFTPRGGRITVSCDADPETVRVTVADTGVGIDSQPLDAVFDPFYQANRRTDRPATGVGLGLAISRDLARGMGGDLTVRSAPGKGAAFTVWLRRAAIGDPWETALEELKVSGRA